MLQVKTSCELKLAADCDNANLILIWSDHHFQQKNMMVLFFQKIPALKSSNLFVV